MVKHRTRLLGIGMYTRADAARLLRMTPSRVNRWAQGYSYWLTYKPEREPREQPPVVRTHLPKLGGAVLLTFLDLMELRVVKALVDQGLSLQYVRRVAKLASDIFRTPYPFASRRVYTDGEKVFASLSADVGVSQIVELTRGRPQIIAGEVFEQYLEEIDFDVRSALAERWWPLGRSVPIVLDPKIAFGAPVIAGTSTRADVVSASARNNDRQSAAEAYQVSLESVDGAVELESFLAAA
jgi:uncharacterized protein (DUF433 family)